MFTNLRAEDLCGAIVRDISNKIQVKSVNNWLRRTSEHCQLCTDDRWYVELTARDVIHIGNKKAMLSQGNHAMQRIFTYTQWLLLFTMIVIYVHCIKADVNVKL